MEIFNDNSQNECEPDDNEENDNTWENIKENAAPLERGRNVGDLKKTFALSNLVSEVELRKNEKTKRRFEKLIAPAEIAAENGMQNPYRNLFVKPGQHISCKLTALSFCNCC